METMEINGKYSSGGYYPNYSSGRPILGHEGIKVKIYEIYKELRGADPLLRIMKSICSLKFSLSIYIFV